MSGLPSPEIYESGRGMDSHNAVMREIRARNTDEYDPEEPTRVWIDEDLTPTGVKDSLTIILNTGGCRWARAGGCTMCGYVAESVKGGVVSHESLMKQVDAALAHEEAEGTACELIKIYTSGSFLDEREIPEQTREMIAEQFAGRDRIVVESLPDFVSGEKISVFRNQDLAVDVAIGLETANDRVRHDCVNKYFEFSDFVRASEAAMAVGGGVKAYLLLKPPFLTEQDAIADAVSSIRACAEYAHTVSVNPTNVQRFTMVEQLYRENGYRPPWLWSVMEVLREVTKVEAIVVSDPVGAGSDRGPHNCGECDEKVARAIKDYSLRQDPSVFEEVSCSCAETWKYVVENETSYNLPLA